MEQTMSTDALNEILTFLDNQTPHDASPEHWAARAYQEIGRKFLAAPAGETEKVASPSADIEEMCRLADATGLVGRGHPPDAILDWAREALIVPGFSHHWIPEHYEAAIQQVALVMRKLLDAQPHAASETDKLPVKWRERYVKHHRGDEECCCCSMCAIELEAARQADRQGG
jgi:hypothetical protein